MPYLGPNKPHGDKPADKPKKNPGISAEGKRKVRAETAEVLAKYGKKPPKDKGDSRGMAQRAFTQTRSERQKKLAEALRASGAE